MANVKSLLEAASHPVEFLQILYLFGKSDIPAAALPSVRLMSHKCFHWPNTKW